MFICTYTYIYVFAYLFIFFCSLFDVSFVCGVVLYTHSRFKIQDRASVPRVKIRAFLVSKVANEVPVSH